MTLKVEPQAVRAYAAKVAQAQQYVQTARSYLSANGNFSPGETGLLGLIVKRHRSYMDALLTMLDHLSDVTDASEHTLKSLATSYEHTDSRSGQRIDGSYPDTPRPPQNEEAQAGNYPAPPTNTW